jgi:hypothetical protein
MRNKSILAVALCFMMFFLVGGCKKSEDVQMSPMGTLLQYSSCKQFMQTTEAEPFAPTPENDCIEFLYDGVRILTLKHINAGFNCCPGEITADIDIGSNRIIITENESTQGCDCLCLFDLQYEIIDLPPGQYTIRIIEPYTHASDEPIVVNVDLRETPDGIFCFSRGHYPWGVF